MYRILRNALVTDQMPQNHDILWLKPAEKGYAFYIWNNGVWEVLRLMYDHGTTNPDDDTPFDPSKSLGPNTVGSEEIIDGSIMLVDLNEEITDKIDEALRGVSTLFIKDGEVRELITTLTSRMDAVDDTLYYKDVYLGVGDISAEVIDNAFHYDEIAKNSYMEMTADVEYLWVIMPETYTPKVQMSGMEVPMTLDDTTLIGTKNYKIWKSDNSYRGTFSICLI